MHPEFHGTRFNPCEGHKVQLTSFSRTFFPSCDLFSFSNFIRPFSVGGQRPIRVWFILKLWFVVGSCFIWKVFSLVNLRTNKYQESTNNIESRKRILKIILYSYDTVSLILTVYFQEIFFIKVPNLSSVLSIKILKNGAILLCYYLYKASHV